MARPTRRNIKTAQRDFDAAIRLLLEWTTVGFLYRPPPAADDEVDQLYEIMVAEGYLAESRGRYAVTAKGRQRLIYLRRSSLSRWASDNYQWLTTTLIATASVVTAIIALVLVATQS